MKHKIIGTGAVLALAICTFFSYKTTPEMPSKSSQILMQEKIQAKERHERAEEISVAPVNTIPVKAQKKNELSPANEVHNDIYFPCSVRIATEQGEGYYLTKADGYVEANVTIEHEGAVVNEITDGEIKVRGNSTAYMPKRPYTVKFEKKQDLFGMGEARKWNLLANAFDPTLMRNFLALKLASDMKLPATPEMKVAEVTVDDRYMGTYLLTEAIDVRKGRLELDENDGDFLLEMDSYMREEAEHIMYPAAEAYVKYPEEVTADAFERISGIYMDIMDTAENGTFEEISEKIDIEEFARYLVYNEFVQTVDFCFSSTFFYYKNGKLHAGPVWDYDGSMGVLDGSYNVAYEQAADPEMNIGDRAIFYYLLKFDEFNELVKKDYALYRERFTEVYREGGDIDRYLEHFQEISELDFSDEVWNVPVEYPDWGLFRKPDETYIENVEFLRSWLMKRQDAMDRSFR